MSLDEQIRQVRGWSQQRDIADRVLPQLEAGHHDDAVLAAFKVVEERLRELTAKPGATGQALVDAAFHPQTGLLIDPQALQAGLEGQYLLFKGAFLVFRNPQAHRFVGLSRAEAFDLIVLANRILSISDDADQRRRALLSVDSSLSALRYLVNYDDLGPYALDADNDGELEVLVPEFDQGVPFKVYDIDAGRSTRAHALAIASAQFYESLEDIVLSDVDNDGLAEIVCALGWASSGGIILFKYRNGQYEPLYREDVPRSKPPTFIDAHVSDFDGDGNVEIVSQPWWSVPADLIPDDYDSGDSSREHPWGRVRYIHRWSRTKDAFELLSRELLYIGGR